MLNQREKINHELLSTVAATKWLFQIFSPICCFQIPLAGTTQNEMQLFWCIIFQYQCCSVNTLSHLHQRGMSEAVLYQLVCSVPTDMTERTAGKNNLTAHEGREMKVWVFSLLYSLTVLRLVLDTAFISLGIKSRCILDFVCTEQESCTQYISTQERSAISLISNP